MMHQSALPTHEPPTGIAFPFAAVTARASRQRKEGRSTRYRVTLSVETLLLLLSIYWTLACNMPFWRALLADNGGTGTIGYIAAVATALTALQFLLLAPVLARWSTRPILITTILIAAVASFHAGQFGIYFDPSMMQNVLQTDPAEAGELLTPRALASIALIALPPLALVLRVQLRRRPLGRTILWRSTAMLIALVITVIALGSIFKDFSSQMRNQKEIRYLVTPAAPLWSLGRVLAHGANVASSSAPRQPIAEDAHLGASWQHAKKPVVLVIVVGETARAASWGLNHGEADSRDTTPELAQRRVINFSDVSSCGTSTAISLPCMFSRQGRRHYDEDAIHASDSLLHVLQRSGLRVVWNDNQSGCKGVCDGLETMHPDPASLPALCTSEHCLDEALTESSRTLLSGSSDSLILVLHQMGNHGPAYYRRHPETYRRFTPSCDTEDLSKCSDLQVRNSYDNAMLYTDHVLAGTIDWLSSLGDHYDTAMLYVSDHGESLGENGLYLHGVPYAIAPREQTHVPMVMWLSGSFAGRNGLDTECLRHQASDPASHDNLFDTVLGLLDVETSAYERGLDLGAPCRAQG